MAVWNFETALVPVTGAASGIGREVCRSLRAAGATPLLLDVDEAGLGALARELYPDAADPGRYTYKLDVTRSAEVDAAFDRMAATHGQITHAVGCAGIVKPTSTMDVPDQDWLRILDVNVNGLFYFCRAAGRKMSVANKGAIVTISSLAGLKAKKDRIAYSTSKGAVVNMTRGMALDLGPHGIRVNSVAPGIIDTPQQANNKGPGGSVEKNIAKTPLGRLGQPAEIASVVLFLLSDLASFVSGDIITVDGGLTAQYS